MKKANSDTERKIPSSPGPESLPISTPVPILARIRRSALIIVSVIFSFFLTQTALAEDNAPVKRGGFQLKVQPIYKNSTIYITTQDGQTTITPSVIKLGLTGKIDFKRRNGNIDQAGVFAGVCKTTNCGFNTLLWYRDSELYTGPAADMIDLPKNDWSINIIVTTSAERLLLTGDKIALINRCKQNPSSKFQHQATLTLSANTSTQEISLGTSFIHHTAPIDIEDVNYNGGDQSRHANFNLEVQCQTVTHGQSTKTPKTPKNNGLGFDHGSMKVKNIRLTFTTFQNGYTEPNPGTRCKKARLRVRMETNQAGLVSFKLWQRRGNLAISNKDYIIGSHHDGNGRFFAVKDLEVRVYKTTKVQANAKELTSEVFQQETGWRDITLICRGVGGGGLAAPTSNDDNQDIPKPSLQGGFTLLDNSAKAKRNQCSRKAKALVWFTNKNADNIHYSLDCGSLGNFSGTLKPKPIGGGKYRAAKIIPFSIKNSIQAGCTLRTVAPGVARDHAKLSRTFSCRKTTGHSRGDGFAGPRKPTHVEPPKTGKKCKTIWKTSCTRRPVKECRNKTSLSCKPVSKKQCKKITISKCRKVAKRTCTNKRTMFCKKKPVRVCKKVGDKLVCKTVVKKQCRPKFKKVCKIKTARLCKPETRIKCSNKVTKICRKKVVKQCKTKLVKFCKPKKQVICRR